MTLGALQKAVEEVTGPSHKTGCRVIADVRDQSVRVHDLYKWTHEYTELLQYLHPHAKVHVQSSAQSLSGFMIYITEDEPPRYLWLRIAGLCVSLAGLIFWGKEMESMYTSIYHYYN